jgi:hypothetical protein
MGTLSKEERRKRNHSHKWDTEIKDFSYWIVLTRVIVYNTGINDVKSLRHKVWETYGQGVEFEYWSPDGKYHGKAYSKQLL